MDPCDSVLADDDEALQYLFYRVLCIPFIRVINVENFLKCRVELFKQCSGFGHVCGTGVSNLIKVPLSLNRNLSDCVRKTWGLKGGKRHVLSEETSLFHPNKYAALALQYKPSSSDACPVTISLCTITVAYTIF